MSKKTRNRIIGSLDANGKVAGESWSRGGKDVNYWPRDEEFKKTDTKEKVKDFINKNIIHKDFKNKIKTKKEPKIITLGSCFASELRYVLENKGYKNEQIWIPSGLNNSFALRQFLEWIYENKTDNSGYWYDETETKKIHKWIPEKEAKIYKKEFSEADVIVITLGLSEVWRDKQTGGVFWRGVPNKIYDANKHIFTNSTVSENQENIEKIIDLIHNNNPETLVVLTLSPVPLKATFKNQPCILSDCVSKSTLRVAIEQACNNKIKNVIYWPSFEVFKWLGNHLDFSVFSTNSRDYSNTCRHANPIIVKSIVDIFLDLFINNSENKNVS